MSAGYPPYQAPLFPILPNLAWRYPFRTGRIGQTARLALHPRLERRRERAHGKIEQTMTPDEQNRRAKMMHEIYHTTFLIRQKLIPDVVSLILHHANIFERCTSSKKELLAVREQGAPCTYLVSDPIQSTARVVKPVQKITFAINSCDQGWVTDPDNGSWTWYTAGVLEKERVKDSEVDILLDSLSFSTRPKTKFLARERQILRNEAGCKDFKLRIVEWSSDSHDEEERNWVRSLQNGDRIVVRVWAKYSGWQNTIKYASIVTYMTAVV